MEEEFNKVELIERLNEGEELSFHEIEFLNSEMKNEISNILTKYKAELSFNLDEDTDIININSEIDWYEPRHFAAGNFLYQENLKPDFHKK